MEEEKIYTIEGRKFKLKKQFNVSDWDISNRIDIFFRKAKVMQGNENAEFLREITKEEFVDFLNDVLIPVDGEKVEKSFLEEMNLQYANEIFLDFFFIYLELNADSGRRLQSLEEKFVLLTEKSKP